MSGYPPPDNEVRDFLTGGVTRVDSYDRSCAFLQALFETTKEKLSQLDSQPQTVAEAAAQFRRLMTHGQRMAGHNVYRRSYYTQVVSRAHELMTHSVRRASLYNSAHFHIVFYQSRLDTPETKPKYQEPDSSDRKFPPANALANLTRVLKSFSSDIPELSSRTKRVKKQKNGAKFEPLVLLAFDEAHTLTTRHQVQDSEWSAFYELRHALRGCHYQPLFSLFLATTGKITQFISMTEDMSARVIEGILVLIPPFTDLGFDHLAKKASVGGTSTLLVFSEDAHMVSLGRALLASIFHLCIG